MRYPKFQENEYYVNTTNNSTSSQITNAMSALPRLRCYVRENSPLVSVKRAINILNYLHKGRQFFTRELKLLLTNNLIDLEPINYFEKMLTIYSADKVNA